MSIRIVPPLLLAWGVLCGASAQTLPPAIEWLPQGAVLVVHVERPAALLEVAADLDLPKSLAGSPDLENLLRLSGMGGKAGGDWKAAVRRLMGGGLVYASYPQDVTVTTLDAEDPVLLDGLQQLARSAASGRFYQEYPGVAMWSMDGKQFVAKAGRRLVVTNRGDMLKLLFAPRQGGGLAAWPLYAQAKKSAGEGGAASLFVNMAALNQLPAFRKSLADGGSPFDILLNGAVKQSLLEAKWLGASLRVDGRKIALHAVTDGKPGATGAAAFTAPTEQGLLPNLTVPRQLAAISLYRDLGKFYAARDSLFPERTSGGILFENFMEIFFTGRNLQDEVFARFKPEVRLAVARQQYDPAVGTPVEQYPAAALVFRVEQAEEFGEIFEEAWQKAIGVQNFTRGQQALPGLIFDKTSHGGVSFTYCHYSARGEKDRAHLPARFNVRPALARVGPYLILSTTDGLAKDLIDAVNREDSRRPATATGAHSVVEIASGADIASLLAINRAELTRQSAVSSGIKPEQAEARLEANMALLRRLAGARLSITATPRGHEADLELRVQ